MPGALQLASGHSFGSLNSWPKKRRKWSKAPKPIQTYNLTPTPTPKRRKKPCPPNPKIIRLRLCAASIQLTCIAVAVRCRSGGPPSAAGKAPLGCAGQASETSTTSPASVRLEKKWHTTPESVERIHQIHGVDSNHWAKQRVLWINVYLNVWLQLSGPGQCGYVNKHRSRKSSLSTGACQACFDPCIILYIIPGS